MCIVVMRLTLKHDRQLGIGNSSVVLTGQNNVAMTSGSVIVTVSNNANNVDFGLNALLTVCTASSVLPDASSTPKPKVANQYDVLNVHPCRHMARRHSMHTSRRVARRHLRHEHIVVG